MDFIFGIFKFLWSAIVWVVSTTWSLISWIAVQAWDLIIKPVFSSGISTYLNSFGEHPIVNAMLLLIVACIYYAIRFYQKQKRSGLKIKPFVITTAIAPFFVGGSSALLNIALPKGPGTTVNINSGNTSTGPNSTVIQGNNNSIGSGNTSVNTTSVDSSTTNSGNTTSTINANRTVSGSKTSIDIKNSTVSGVQTTQGSGNMSQQVQSNSLSTSTDDRKQ